MKLKIIISFVFLLILPYSLFADQSFYCPQNHGYINVGMTSDQVVSACGQPVSKQDSNQPVVQKIPVTQLFYNNVGAHSAFYGVWNLPTGTAGSRLQVNIVDNKVKSFSLNGSDNNSISICDEINIQVGDDAGKVYGACGTPTTVNNTYINQIMPTAEKPQIWIYQPSQFQPPITLTFVNGKLQSIN